MLEIDNVTESLFSENKSIVIRSLEAPMSVMLKIICSLHHGASHRMPHIDHSNNRPLRAAMCVVYFVVKRSLVMLSRFLLRNIRCGGQVDSSVARQFTSG